MWWVFKTAIVRKIAYLLVAAAFAMLMGHRARAQTPCYDWIGKAGVIASSAAAACATYDGVDTGSYAGYIMTFRELNGGVSGTGAGQTASCNYEMTDSAGADYGERYNLHVVSVSAGTCPVSPTCSVTASKSYNIFVGGGSPVPDGTAMCGSDGCGYTAANAANGRKLLEIDHAGHQLIVQDGVGTGASCVPSSGPASPSNASPGSETNNGAQNTTCIQAGGNIACATQSAAGKNCGTYNNDQVCVADVPAGTCVTYASGGVACSAALGTTTMQSPPAPNNGTSGSPATPSETLILPAGTTNYYSATVVNNSSGVQVGKGAPVPPGTTTGTDTGTTGTGPSAANGDCGGTGVDCTGDGGTPSLTRADTIQSNVQAYLDAIAASPLVSAMTAINSAWPTASCPTVNFTLWGHELDANAAICTVWGETVAPTLSLVFLAIWAVSGIRVILSA